MITIFVRDCNQISQSFYDSVIYNLQLHQLTCSCGHAACLSVHGYYRRTVKLPSGPVRLRICRVKCSECGATHANLLASMVPYSQIPLSDQQRICSDYEEGRCISSVCETNPSIDENNAKSVLLNYRRCWREKLRSLRIRLFPLESLNAYFRTVSAKGIKAPRLCDCPDRRCQPVYPGGRCRAMVPLHRSAFSISMTTPL